LDIGRGLLLEKRKGFGRSRVFHGDFAEFSLDFRVKPTVKFQT